MTTQNSADSADSNGDQPRGELAIRTLAMPADTNPSGDIFGGWVMAQMDVAGGIVAAQHANGRVATVAVDGFIFHKPVNVGDVLCCYADVVRVGHTSIALRIEAWALRQRARDRRVRVTEGIFTFVALDENGKKRPVRDS
ncbi:MAG: acyl-CoA thioesterase [Rhodospirillaceae bacterium]|nr:acyl-CoA thioesterase [Magnetovibrio sp.]MAY66722.1 acyl-CoA thioesterase [Rhodospirillaceae bacterium]